MTENTYRPLVSRRRFIETVAAFAGTATMAAGLASWGVATASATKTPPSLKGSGTGKKVVILGGGWAGLVSCYELSQQGYDCVIIEANPYIGGRAQTARNGTKVQQLGKDPLECTFAEGEYLNYGPWRIPFNHYSTLYYTRLFGIPVETMVNQNDAAFVYSSTGPMAGKRVRQFEIKADVRGYTDELMCKLAASGQLDGYLSKDDEEKFVEYLISEGYLKRDSKTYEGTTGRGFDVNPGAGLVPGPGVPSKPFSFSDVLNSNMWQSVKSVGEFEQQNTMLEPVGGMDRTPKTFAKYIGDKIRMSCQVEKIDQNAKGVTVNYLDKVTGAHESVSGDYCICTIPISVLKNIDANFSKPFKAAMDQVAYAAVGKIGLQMKRRFWEEDDGVYGGHVYTDNEFGLLSLPSYNLMGKTGTILGGYLHGATGIKYSAMSYKDQFDAALANGALVWPKTMTDEFASGFSYYWHLDPHNLGGWAEWSEDARKTAYPVLLEPDNRIYLAGEHLSYLGGWQAGAIESAWQQIEKLHLRASAA
ncbi:NAD(P)/FAD-dependent oxidoreductase [Asticcacaulis sp. EMRT-3]|uniref:flavin monoamine oxidase family protein n=1 Tax=Asticcacaulis sp. EMRT-3 TaxID=3040349 RepID=UPI0024AF7764|nr:NAD(P)/FAD-dependent oxidoreductase [Asticcacaulis sp. EMRT-3]MDI7775942.1 NAD(P)/FAD-dependent oxidoreductase [Asticcacaulis sp. EMRT-3]